MSIWGRLGRALRLIAVAAALAPAGALADASAWKGDARAEVRLISAVVATGTAETLQLGLQFRLQPGWKVYWRHAGDAGYPPSIVWSGDNVAAAEMSWPMPMRFQVLGLQSIGYADAVVYPVALRLARPGEPLQAEALVDYLICSDICIPQEARLALTLPSGPADAGGHAHDIGRFLSAVPGDGAAHGLTLERVETWGEGDRARLRVALRAEPPLAAPDLFVEAPDNIQFEPPTLRHEDGGRRIVLEAAVAEGTGAGSLVGRSLTITVGADGRGLERAVTPRAAAAPSSSGLLTMIGLALIGGLILNLMPCVLPVLSIKVLGLIGHGGADRRHIRASFVASSAGIVVSFLALAGLAVGLKAAGMAIGWGIQFQQPLFLVFLTVVVTLFAANLWGLFEVPMPGWLSGVGAGHGQPQSLPGHFLTGAFATLLATPCTAPFLGTAVGFALGHGTVEIVAIFAGLGVGMASPYLAVAAMPGLAQRLPRPGRWMITLRKIMGVALAATGIWLVTVLAAQTGLAAAGTVALMMAALPLLLAARLRLSGGARRAAVLAVVALSGLAFVPPLRATAPDAGAAPRAGDAAWVGFDRDEIVRLVTEGRTVFVDVTADWCITCQVNKLAVLDRSATAALLAAPDVVAMRADWTNPDDRIAAYLALHGRYGIPFNAVYGPAAPEGVVLPELLTEAAVVAAFERARGAGPRTTAATE